MSKNNRVSLSDPDLQLERVPLPEAPVSQAKPAIEIDRGREVEEAHVPPTQPDVYVPPTPKKEPMEILGVRVPTRLKEKLREIAQERGIDMSVIVIDLLEIHVPKIPRLRKQRGFTQ